MSARFSPARITSAIVVAVAGAIVLYRFDPVAHGFYPQCMFHVLTGLQCPGCGGTRAVYRLLHGDISGAFRLNQLIFALPPFLLISARWPRLLTKPAFAWTACVLVIAYGVVRNLPFWPYPL